MAADAAREQPRRAAAQQRHQRHQRHHHALRDLGAAGLPLGRVHHGHQPVLLVSNPPTWHAVCVQGDATPVECIGEA
jgi:hypothetical protein